MENKTMKNKNTGVMITQNDKVLAHSKLVHDALEAAMDELTRFGDELSCITDFENFPKIKVADQKRYAAEFIASPRGQRAFASFARAILRSMKDLSPRGDFD